MDVTVLGQRVISVLIVEDHQMVAEALAATLSTADDLRVIAHVGTIAAGNAALSDHPVDVVLMDYHLPDGTGVAAADRIRREHSSTRVLIVSAVEDDGILKDALRVGCSGYLCKLDSLQDLAIAVRAAHAGSTAVSPRMMTRFVEASVAKPEPIQNDDLSEREMQVLRLLGNGHSNGEIASALVISPNTVRNHTQRILEKLDAHSRLEAVLKALQDGLIAPPA